MRYLTLGSWERKTLEEGYCHHPKHHFRQRCHALLLSDEGQTVPQIAKLFKTRTRTIYTWMNRWQNTGIVGLMILPGRGLKSKFSTHDSNLVGLIKKSQTTRT